MNQAGQTGDGRHEQRFRHEILAILKGLFVDLKQNIRPVFARLLVG